jgi:SDR family mycofactocin-dependent oxidoreductase
MDGMTGRVALVTGAARGIGAATVHALVQRDYRVLALDSCAGEGQATPEELHALVEPYADQVVPVIADVRDRAALDAAAAQAIRDFGRLDAAVAAAAVMAGGQPQWQTAEADLRRVLEVDLIGVWHTAAAVVPHMLAGPAPHECRFVAIASAAGERGLYGLSAYTAAKHGVIGLVRALAEDLIGTGVTAVAVAPGSTRTEMLAATARLYGLSTVDDFAGSALLRRLLDPAEVAATIAFCCSVDAAALNGSVVRADGGFR